MLKHNPVRLRRMSSKSRLAGVRRMIFTITILLYTLDY